ncbi:MAG: hypothetical protein FJY97_14010 [candidate division Zixibacteria bacterium]|nr:hypothetical protein [candidate division Zixibacteria bacterium]
MLRYCLLVCVWIAALSVGAVRTALAEPHLAVREGMKCSACHTNITGQGKRNQFGIQYEQQSLPMRTIKDSTIYDILSQYMTETFSLGLDFRFQNTTIKGIPGADSPGHLFANSFLVKEAQVYAEINVVKNRFLVYLDERIMAQPGSPTDSREVMGIIQGLPLKGYVRAGKMYLPYGLRIWDPDALILTKTGVLDSEFGFSVGMEPGPLVFHAALQNGEPLVNIRQNTGKQVTASLAYVSRYGRIGGSVNHNPKAAQLMGAGFMGVGVGPVTLLGEFDYMRFTDFQGSGRTLLQYVGYGEANLRIFRGLHLKSAIDYFDAGFAGGDQQRYQGGIEFRPVPFIQSRVLYVHNRPKLLPGGVQAIGNGDRLVLELHIFL